MGLVGTHISYDNFGKIIDTMLLDGTINWGWVAVIYAAATHTDPTSDVVPIRNYILQLDNTAKRCGIMAVLHITDYDALALTHDIDNKRGNGMQE